MNKIPIEPGRVVLSKAGRDAGRRFVVLKVDESYAWVADGDLRKATALKKKKHRHLRATPAHITDVAALLAAGKLPTDAQLRKCLSEGAESPADRP